MEGISNMGVIMYGTATCGKCHVLRSKLEAANIDFQYIDDIPTIKASVPVGWLSLPILNVDGQFYQFSDAIQWVNQKGSHA